MSRQLPAAYFGLSRMRDFLSDRDNWCKHRLRQNDARCLMGALIDHGGAIENRLEIAGYLDSAIHMNPRWRHLNISQFNDLWETTHKTIMTVLDRAMKMAAKEPA
jgi:hypothetical protein